MNIQLFGKKKCFDTKKAERWFKERRIKFQSVDLLRFGLSGGEFDSVLRAVGGVDALIDWDAQAPRSTSCATWTTSAPRKTSSSTTPSS